MSTITEIEAANERLPAPQVAQLAAWLEEFRERSQVGSVDHPELDALVGTWREDEGFDAAMRAFAAVTLPDFATRARAIWEAQAKGAGLSGAILAEREERW